MYHSYQTTFDACSPWEQQLDWFLHRPQPMKEVIYLKFSTIGKVQPKNEKKNCDHGSKESLHDWGARAKSVNLDKNKCCPWVKSLKLNAPRAKFFPLPNRYALLSLGDSIDPEPN